MTISDKLDAPLAEFILEHPVQLYRGLLYGWTHEQPRLIADDVLAERAASDAAYLMLGMVVALFGLSTDDAMQGNRLLAAARGREPDDRTFRGFVNLTHRKGDS